MVFFLTLILTGVSVYIVFQQVQLNSPDPQAADIDPPVTFEDENNQPGSNLPPFDPNDTGNQGNPDNNRPKDGTKRPPEKKDTKKPDETTPQPKNDGGVSENPQSQKEFQKILESPQRDQYLLKIIQNRWRYCYVSLHKIAQLKLVHLEPQLRDIYNQVQASPQRQKLRYFLLQILRTIWLLNGNVSPEEKEQLQKANLIPKGQG